MKIYFYRAECGDAARVSYRGEDGQYHNIFIDSGYERTFDLVLRQEIEKIHARAERIDLWIISHIHDDHIGGVTAYMDSIQSGKLPDIVVRWFYNSPRATDLERRTAENRSAVTLRSIQQGDQLTKYLMERNKSGNVDITNKSPEEDLSGLKLQLLGPEPEQLVKLRAKYAPGKVRALERIEAEPPEAARQFDYHIPIEDFDLKQWKEDDSVENGSSITLLMDYKGRKILWLADALPGTIMKSLKKLGYSKSNPLVCDWVKVTHHGSKGNNSVALYSMIRCNNYLLSVEGLNKHCLPTKECLARIILNPSRPVDSEYHFRFTYNNKILKKIFQVDGPEVFVKYRFKVSYSSRKWIKV